MNNNPIGIFDSGVGGLTVLNAFSKVAPKESILYLGDTARVPYGNKSKAKIEEFSYEITQWLISQGCKLIIIACNTASSLALEKLQSMFNIPIIGVIQPGVTAAIQSTKNKKIAVLGTYATINSDVYRAAIEKKDNRISVISKACPLFVHLAEEGMMTGSIPESIANLYLDDIKNTQSDTIILGCTHYPLLKDIIKKVLNSDITLIDSGEATAHYVAGLLKSKDLMTDNNKVSINCFVTDSVSSFKKIAFKFVDAKIDDINKVDIK